MINKRCAAILLMVTLLVFGSYLYAQDTVSTTGIEFTSAKSTSVSTVKETGTSAEVKVEVV